MNDVEVVSGVITNVKDIAIYHLMDVFGWQVIGINLIYQHNYVAFPIVG